MSRSQSVIKKEGQVIETLPGTMFCVKMDDGSEVLTHLSGKMRMFHIKILLGDRVIVEMSPSDQTKGRIVRRM